MSDKHHTRELFLKALDRLDAGNFKEAELLFAETLKYAPHSLPTLNNLAICQYEQGRHGEAAQTAQRALEVDQSNFDAHAMVLSCQLERGDTAGAIKSCEKIIAIDPRTADAHCLVGNAFHRLNRPHEAIKRFDRALSIQPNFAEAWVGRGKALLHGLRRYEDAFEAYDKALALKPDLLGVEGQRLYCKLQICDWRDYDAACARVIASVRNKNHNISPFELQAVPASLQDKRDCAELWMSRKCPASPSPMWRGEHYEHDRIRLAYVSSDFREHAISYLMARVFELHDRNRFLVSAISIGADKGSPMRTRLKSTFDTFIDATTLSDAEVASRIRQDEIDVLVDLNGYTSGSRTGIFAFRPAPIQVNYLGYTGTMAAPYIDYLIADETVIPRVDQKHYSEKIVYLPDCYFPSDNTCAISDRPVTRAEFQLPENGFVFCCFNNNFKITPAVFEVWMRILQKVEGSVLWLLDDNAASTNNLRREAAARGVIGDRLVFARRVAPADHLARHRAADLFLDTLPYNAHTTATDALWAGVPIVTQIGGTFAGRVAASVLTALGLPELITTTPREYEEVAVELASNPARLAALKTKLDVNRSAMPLFDSDLFTKNIEAAYLAMLRRVV